MKLRCPECGKAFESVLSEDALPRSGHLRCPRCGSRFTVDCEPDRYHNWARASVGHDEGVAKYRQPIKGRCA